MYKIPAGTLFAGKNLVYVPQCHSTNTLAAEQVQLPETAEGTVIITDNQTSGRGQRGTVWESTARENLTFSLILKPSFLAAKDQFQLSEAIALGVAEYASQHLVQRVLIKWPNDIMAVGKKVAGILIENHISGDSIGYSIVGIGLNMNQQSFAAPHAASLGSLAGKMFNLSDELDDLLTHVENCYLELKSGKHAELEVRYLSRLYRKDEVHRFTENGSVFEGVITGVNHEGKLRVKIGTGERVFGVKEIGFV